MSLLNYQYCYICASDEGLLLDIFGDDGNTISKNIDICLSVKIQQHDAATRKICHKCVYELDACSKFVEKYRQKRNATGAKSKRQCNLCSEPGKKGYIFDCKDGKPLNGLAQKIQEVFDDNIFKDKQTNLSICLNCRYNLDVLFDLKCIYQTTPDKLRRLDEKRAELSNFPKTKTRVVNRKTTYTLPQQLNGNEVSDTDSSSVASMPLPRKRGRPRKDSASAVSSSTFRNCGECENIVENEIGMYRYHRTGRTVCRECWLSMDPAKITHTKKKKLGLSSGDIGTRKCAIILKDVLANPAKYENIYKVEKDEQGNKTYIVTDDSSESEDREKTPVKKSRKVTINEIRVAQLAKARAAKRTTSTRSTDVEDEPPTKVKKSVKQIDEEKPLPSRSMRTRNGLTASDTEVFSSKTKRTTSTDNKSTKKTKSDAEIVKPLPKKRGRTLKTRYIETIESSSTDTKVASTSRSQRATKIAITSVESPKKVERPARRTRATSLTNDDTISLSKRLNTLSQNSETIVETVSPPTRSKKSKTKSLSPKNSGSELELEKPYICSVCNVEYKNKLIGMKHELTHAKQPEVILERVAIPEIIVTEVPPTDDTSILIEEPEEQSHNVSSTSENQGEQLENLEKIVTPNEETSNVVKEIIDNNETLEDSLNLPQVDETPTEIVQEIIKEKEKTVDNETEAPEITDTNEDTKVNENIEEISRVEDNAPINTEIETNDDEKETENITEQSVNIEKLESTPNEEIVKEIEINESVERASEEISINSLNTSEEIVKESTETSTNGINVENNSQSEITESNELEKEEISLESDKDSKITDVCNPDENVEDEKLATITNISTENNIEDKILVEDNANDKQENQTTQDLEDKTRDIDETSITEDTTKVSNNESEIIVKDILTEVFDLATAEVLKRIENAIPHDEKCTTPVDETLENISLEICNTSADMPSLETADEESAKKQL